MRLLNKILAFLFVHHWHFKAIFGKHTYVVIRQKGGFRTIWVMWALIDEQWYLLNPERNGGHKTNSRLPQKLLSDYLILAGRKSEKFLPLNQQQFLELYKDE